nr:reverse transcriptase domain-containing protein [Tanacetum cinerariifolium]
MVYRPKEKSNNVDVEYMYKKPEENCSNDATQNTGGNKKEISPNKNIWMIDKGSLENLKMNANKFVVVQDNDTKYVWNDPSFDKRKGNESNDEEDVIEMNDMATSNLVADEINGMSKATKQNEVLKLINNERICIRWDPMVVKVVIIHESRQCIICEVENMPDEHSARSSVMTNDMQEFNDLVNLIEVDDICSSSFFYTWTKSMRNPNNSIIKKLDRVMINKAFMKEFGNAHGVFLPYMNGWTAGRSRGRTRGRSGDQGDDRIDGQGGQVGGQGSEPKLVTKVEVKEMVGIKTMIPSMTTSGVMDSQKVKYTSGSFVGNALTWWNSQIHTRGREVMVGMSWKEFKTLTREEFYPSNEIQRLEIELLNHVMVGAGYATHTDRFHELARLVPHLVTPKGKRIERYVYGLAQQILGMVAATKPKTIQNVMQIVGTLTDEALRNGSIKKNPEKR